MTGGGGTHWEGNEGQGAEAGGPTGYEGQRVGTGFRWLP